MRVLLVSLAIAIVVGLALYLRAGADGPVVEPEPTVGRSARRIRPSDGLPRPRRGTSSLRRRFASSRAPRCGGRSLETGPLAAFHGQALLQRDGETPRAAALGSIEFDVIHRGRRDSMSAKVQAGRFDVRIPEVGRVRILGGTLEGQAVRFPGAETLFDPGDDDYVLVGVPVPASVLDALDALSGAPLAGVTVRRGDDATAPRLVVASPEATNPDPAPPALVENATSPITLPWLDAPHAIWLHLDKEGYAPAAVLVEPNREARREVRLWPEASLTVRVAGPGREWLHALVLLREEGDGRTPHAATFSVTAPGVRREADAIVFEIEGLAALPHRVEAKGYDGQGHATGPRRARRARPGRGSAHHARGRGSVSDPRVEPGVKPLRRDGPRAEALPARRAGTPLYVHLPFCAAKCHYCDFFSRAPRRARTSTGMVDGDPGRGRAAARRARRGRSSWAAGRPRLLLGRAARRACSTGSSELTGFRGLGRRGHRGVQPREPRPRQGPRAAGRSGVTRLSIGFQSLRRRRAGALRPGPRRGGLLPGLRGRPRRPGAASAQRGPDLRRSRGSSRGPGREDLERVLALGPDHVSAYNLTFEEETRLPALARAGAPRALARGGRAAFREFPRGSSSRRIRLLPPWIRPAASRLDAARGTVGPSLTIRCSRGRGSARRRSVRGGVRPEVRSPGRGATRRTKDPRPHKSILLSIVPDLFAARHDPCLDRSSRESGFRRRTQHPGGFRIAQSAFKSRDGRTCTSSASQ